MAEEHLHSVDVARYLVGPLRKKMTQFMEGPSTFKHCIREHRNIPGRKVTILVPREQPKVPLREGRDLERERLRNRHDADLATLSMNSKPPILLVLEEV